MQPADWPTLGFSSSAVSAATAWVKCDLFPFPPDVARGYPTRGSVCTVQMLQAGGSQLARSSLLIASSLKLATENRGVPGDNGYPFDHAAKPWAFLSGKVLVNGQYSISAHTIKPGAAVSGRMLPSWDTIPEADGPSSS